MKGKQGRKEGQQLADFEVFMEFLRARCLECSGQ